MPMNSEKQRRGWLALGVLVVCALAPALARAATDAENKAQAKELYERATRFYDVGKYAEAIHDYEQAYLLVEDPALLFNMGQAYRLWDRPEDAIRSYKNYLRKRPEASNRADVERKIADLEKLVEERRRNGGLPAAAPAQPGQDPVPTPGEPPPQPYAGQPGPYQAQPSAQPGFTPGTAASEPAGVVPTGAEPPRSKRNWLAWGLIAGGGTGLLVAALAAAAGRQDANKLRDASKNHEAFDPTLEKNGKAANALAYVGLAAGVVLGGVGGYLLWHGRSARAVTASVIPTVTPTFAGGSAMLTF
jgi:tetratricopeptide (TPR) repeat protein